jgi:hypothetical protein
MLNAHSLPGAKHSRGWHFYDLHLNHPEKRNELVSGMGYYIRFKRYTVKRENRSLKFKP